MAWSKSFKKQKKNNRLNESLYLEQLEQRQLLAGDPVLLEINVGGGSSSPTDFEDVNGTLFFRANDGANGVELWMSDGTSAGTTLVKDILSGSSSSTPNQLTNVNGTLFFEANDGSGDGLWRSDGTSAGTYLIKTFSDGFNEPEAVGSLFFFRANGDAFGTELWVSDGTSAGTVRLSDINTGGSTNISNTTNVNGTLFFRADDAGSYGAEVWKSDGTTAGTELLKDIFAGSGGSNPGEFVAAGSTLFFYARNNSYPHNPWISDGTSAGTELIKVINTGTDYQDNYTEVNGTLFFIALNGSVGEEVFVSDGTSAGTDVVKDIVAGGGSSNPNFLINVNGTLFFEANDGTNGEEPWFSDGSSAGTMQLANINPCGNSDPFYFTSFDNSVYFRANDGSGHELWVSNGTSGGTSLVKDLNAGGGSNVANLTVSGSNLFFTANDGSNGTELWVISNDSTPPTLEITPDGLITNQSSTTFTFQFSEEVTGFTADDVTFDGDVNTNGFVSKGTFTAVDGDTYTLEVFYSNANGDLIVNVADDVAIDGAGNGNDGDSATITYDSVAPTLEITPDGTSTNAGSTLFTFQFSEGVTGFTIDDVDLMSSGPIVTPGTFTAVDEDTYTLEVFHSNGNGDIIVSVDADEATDAAGNGNLGDSATVTYDTIAPTLEITPDGTITNSEIILFTFEFSEDVTGFTTGDVVVTNGTKGIFNATDGNTYTLTVTPTADGDVTVTVADAVAQDAATNDNTGDMATVTYDGTAPTVAVTPDNLLTNMATTLFTFEFSEEVFDFTADDVMVTNGTKGTFTAVDGDTYTLEVTAVADGDVIVNALADGAMDAAGNGNVVGSATVTYDGTAPTVIITPDSGVTNDDPITFTFEFSEEIFEFIEDDVMITGGVGSNFTMVDGDTYTIDVTPDADGDITVSVADEGAEDEAGNLLAGDMATIEYDGTAPTLEISPDTGETNDDPILFLFVFSEDVTGFESSDIIVTGGTAGTFTTIDDDIYTLEVTPDEEDGDVTVTVADAVAQDAAMNDNVGDSATITYNAIDEKSLIVTGSDAGDGIVRVFDETGTELMSFFPYTEAFTGGVRVATGDINGDGVLDIVTAAGPGGGPRVSVFDSETGELITGGVNDFFAYAPTITTGVFVAVGDVNDDGYDDIITSPDAGGGPHIKVFSGEDGSVLTEFYAYASTITVGVRVAAGDIDGNGTAEVITAPGPGGGPHVRVFDGQTGAQMAGAATNFYAYAANVTTGVFVASGDVDGDGFDDIITAPGAGGGPHVKVFSSDDASLLQNFYAYDPSFVGGVRVGAADINQDGYADILTVPGPSGGPHTRAFDGTDLSDLASFFSGDSGNTDGLFVAGGISLVPIELGPFSSLLITSTEEETPEDLTPEDLQKKKSWYDEVDEFYQNADKIDKLFSGLGIE
ncbi:Hypothetical protein PBC10988_17670 [Planctomycetales bacterium 10988]|nr:Hypothetical protein PBC10988_17670 [Planctomycetales bacterium 10988]